MNPATRPTDHVGDTDDEHSSSIGGELRDQRQSDVVRSSTQKRSIVFVSPSLAVGGAEQMTVEFANAARRAGLHVTIVLFNEPALLKEQLDVGCTLVNLEVGRTRHAFGSLWRCLRRLKPDIVMTTHHRTSVLVAALKPLCPSFRHIARLPNTPSAEMAVAGGNNGMWELYRRVYASRDLVVAQSEGMALDAVATLRLKGKIKHYGRDTDAVHWKGIIVVPNPFPKKWLLPREARSASMPISGFCILAAGRLTRAKGFDLLIGALPYVLEHRRDARLFIAGSDQGQGEELRQLAEDLNVGDRVHFLGHRDDLRNLMVAADIFVLASRYEGYPNVLLEAMSTNTPVVATQCIQAVDELVVDGINGFKAKVGSVGSLVEAIIGAANLRRDEIANDVHENDATSLMRELAEIC